MRLRGEPHHLCDINAKGYFLDDQGQIVNVYEDEEGEEGEELGLYHFAPDRSKIYLQSEPVETRFEVACHDPSVRSS